MKANKWEYNTDPEWSGGAYYRCPHCQSGFSVGEFHDIEHTFIYCPHCGEYMGEDDD